MLWFQIYPLIYIYSTIFGLLLEYNGLNKLDNFVYIIKRSRLLFCLGLQITGVERVNDKLPLLGWHALPAWIVRERAGGEGVRKNSILLVSCCFCLEGMEISRDGLIKKKEN